MTQRNKRILKPDEEDKLRSTAQEESLRDYMLIFTTLKHGLRNSEAVSLKRKHIDLDEDIIRVDKSKHDKGRLVPIPSKFSMELEYYIEQKGFASEDYLFPSKRRDHHLSTRAFEMIMRHYAVESDLYPENITEDNVAMRIPYRERIVPHSLRHTYATRLLRAGESMAKVSQLLGHEDPEVTVSIYGHLNVEDLRTAAEKVSV